jgi:hypothetical protein
MPLLLGFVGKAIIWIIVIIVLAVIGLFAIIGKITGRGGD